MNLIREFLPAVAPSERGPILRREMERWQWRVNEIDSRSVRIRAWSRNGMQVKLGHFS